VRGRLAGAALAGGVLLVLVGAGPAAAHNRLRSSDPADGSSLARTPEAVVLTLDEPPVALGTRVLVTGPDGPVAQGAPQLVDETVRQPLVGGAPAGRYTVEWRATSADGHPVSGRFSFVSEAAGSGTPGPVTPTQEAARAASPGWGWLVLALALLTAAAVVALLGRRARAAPQD
jgi:methionine-rich copper-binding protein CopC